jgi:hypothetical protein
MRRRLWQGCGIGCSGSRRVGRTCGPALRCVFIRARYLGGFECRWPPFLPDSAQSTMTRAEINDSLAKVVTGPLARARGTLDPRVARILFLRPPSFCAFCATSIGPGQPGEAHARATVVKPAATGFSCSSSGSISPRLRVLMMRAARCARPGHAAIRHKSETDEPRCASSSQRAGRAGAEVADEQKEVGRG